ncbi:hypothetical protein D3C86_723030 [compost metagenome]
MAASRCWPPSMAHSTTMRVLRRAKRRRTRRPCRSGRRRRPAPRLARRPRPSARRSRPWPCRRPATRRRRRPATWPRRGPLPLISPRTPLRHCPSPSTRRIRPAPWRRHPPRQTRRQFRQARLILCHTCRPGLPMARLLLACRLMAHLPSPRLLHPRFSRPRLSRPRLSRPRPYASSCRPCRLRAGQWTQVVPPLHRRVRMPLRWRPPRPLSTCRPLPRPASPRPTPTCRPGLLHIRLQRRPQPLPHPPRRPWPACRTRPCASRSCRRRRCPSIRRPDCRTRSAPCAARLKPAWTACFGAGVKGPAANPRAPRCSAACWMPASARSWCARWSSVCRKGSRPRPR